MKLVPNKVIAIFVVCGWRFSWRCSEVDLAHHTTQAISFMVWSMNVDNCSSF